MGKIFSISRTLTFVAATIAFMTILNAPASFAQTDSQSRADRAREAQIELLKGRIDKLQAQLGKLESVQHGQVASPGAVTAKGGNACCPGGAPSNGSEQPPAAPPSGLPMEHGMSMGNPMGGQMGKGMGGGGMQGGMGGGGMGGGGMQGGADGGAQPQASPSAGME